MTETYVCAHCATTEERTYGVQYLIQTCTECGEHGRFVHGSLLELLEGIPEADRPDDWEELAVDERLLRAVREGLVDYRETLVR